MAELESNFARFATVPKTGGASFVNATGANTFGLSTNTQTIFTAGIKGAVVSSVFVLSNDTVALIAHLYIEDGGVLRPICALTVPANSGTNGTVLPLDLLSAANASFLPINNQGKRELHLPNSALLKVGFAAAVSATRTAWVTANGNDFVD